MLVRRIRGDGGDHQRARPPRPPFSDAHDRHPPSGNGRAGSRPCPRDHPRHRPPMPSLLATKRVHIPCTTARELPGNAGKKRVFRLGVQERRTGRTPRSEGQRQTSRAVGRVLSPSRASWASRRARKASSRRPSRSRARARLLRVSGSLRPLSTARSRASGASWGRPPSSRNSPLAPEAYGRGTRLDREGGAEANPRHGSRPWPFSARRGAARAPATRDFTVPSGTPSCRATGAWVRSA
jgi:hypothetical protein